MTGIGVVRKAFGITTIAASGNNLSLGGQLFGSAGPFGESAPLQAMGTFSLR